MARPTSWLATRLARSCGRSSLIASQLVGLAMLRYVIKVETIANASSQDLARWVGPGVQRYLTDPAMS